MAKILITGATGNVGKSLIHFLMQNNSPHEIIAGVRDPSKATAEFNDYTRLRFRAFDFEDTDGFASALRGIDILFLLRPPHLSNIKKYFTPLIEVMVKNKVLKVVFLSVQGAEKSKIIPHHKIEKLIINAGIEYIFLRPSYFMQNLTTTLYQEVKNKQRISLPAGKSKFNWVDVNNIGEIAGIVLNDFNQFKNNVYEITGSENLSFQEAVDLINQETDRHILYKNTHPIRYFLRQKREGVKSGLILVMIFLHYLPRFQKEPVINPFYTNLTKKKPTTLKEFIKSNKPLFETN